MFRYSGIVILVLGLFAVPLRQAATAQRTHANDVMVWRSIALGADIAFDGAMVVKADAIMFGT